MSLRDNFFACAGDLKPEEHKLPDGTLLYVGEAGGDEWLEIEAETLKARALNGSDPFVDARLIVRSVMGADNKPVFKRFVPSGDEKKDKEALADYEAELQRIVKMPQSVLIPLLRKVNRVNFTDNAAELKKKSVNGASIGSSSSPETAANSTSENSSGESADSATSPGGEPGTS